MLFAREFDPQRGPWMIGDDGFPWPGGKKVETKHGMSYTYDIYIYTMITICVYI